MDIRQAFSVVRGGNEPNINPLEIGYHLLRSPVAEVERLGLEVGQSPHLKELLFRWDRDAPVENLQSFLRGLRGNQSVEKCSFQPQQLLGEEILPLFTSFIEQNPNLTKLDICHVKYEDNEDTWGEEFEVLRSIVSAGTAFIKSISYFFYSDPSITNVSTGEFCTLLLESLSNLEELKLTNDNDWDMPPTLDVTGCAPIIRMLQSPESKLRLLDMCFGRIEDNALKAIIQVLNQNTELRHLKIWLDERAFGYLLDSLRFHNLTLETVEITGIDMEDDVEIPPEIKSLLILNSQDDKESIRLRKCLDYDYLIPERPFNGEPYDEGFDLRLLPFVLSSIVNIRSERDHRNTNCRKSSLYHFVRNQPLLVVKSCCKK